jgi:hypothetical protein
MSGGQTPVTQQTTQTRDPWAAAQPHLTGIMNAADQVFAGVGPYSNVAGGPGYMPYTGQTQVDLNPLTSSGLAAQTQMAQGGQPSVDASLGLASQQIRDYGLSPELKSLYDQISTTQNPVLQSIIDTNNRRIGDRINSSMSGAGRYGSAQHTDVLGRALAESADPLLAQDYQARQEMRNNILTGGLQRAGQWSQLAPTLEQAKYAPLERITGMGQFLDARAQAALNDQIKLYNAQQAYPWEQLSRYNALIGGAGALGGTSVTSSPIQQPSMLQSGLGGAAAGASIGSIFGAPGAAIGGIGGGLLGLLNR